MTLLELDHVIEQRFMAGMGYARIAEGTGLTFEQVRYTVRRKGITAKDRIAKRRAEVARLRRQGVFVREIAARFYVNPSTIVNDIAALRAAGEQV